jgi:hypothetical protein
MERRMSDKLDFSGFDAPAEPSRPPPKKRSTPKPAKAARKKPPKQAVSRRKLRVNVSIDPGLSRRVIDEANRRGSTLSDLLRASYRANIDRIDLLPIDSEPPPFSPRPSTPAGRVVHMLYLTADEVGILDDLAARFGSTRSGVVAAMFAHVG